MWRNSGVIGTAIALACGSAGAATLEGVVKDANGKPLQGVFVMAAQAERKMTTAVVSDPNGHFTLKDLYPEQYTLSASRIGYAPSSVSGYRLAYDGGTQDFQLAPTDPTNQLPGNMWLAALPDGEFKARFITGCTICHDAGSEAMRKPRNEQEWVAAIQMMRDQLDIYSVIPKFEPKELAAWLVEQKFASKPADIPIPDPGQDGTAKATVTIYDVGYPDSWAHDMVIEPATGAAWVGDYPYDELVRIDPVTGEQKRYKLPTKGGGMHTLHFDTQGKLWITLQLADMVASFDPKNESFQLYRGFRQGSLIHSFAYDEQGLVSFDKQGRMWLSEFGTNSVASLNPETGEIKEYDLLGEEGHTYGIALDSKDRVWFTKYVENIYGMLDPASGQVIEKQLPRAESAPHRMCIDDADRLWIPNSSYSTLVRYDIATDTLEEFDLPDKDVFPYASRYDGATGTVWVQGNGSSSIYRFDPQTKQFTSFRMPLHMSYGRMVAFDYKTGSVWTSLSNYPNKHTGRATGSLVRFSGIEPPPRAPALAGH